MSQKFLSHVHGERDALDAQELYAAWAETYDDEVTGAGYVTPGRCAEVLTRLGAARDAAILDYGCGTGLAGLALAQAGFTHLEGADVSAEMLEKAGARPDVYADLHRIEPEAPLPFAPRRFAHVVAAGVITPDHAPPETIDALLALLAPGGFLVFSLNDHALTVPAFPERVEAVVDAGLATREVAEAGPHLPAKDLGATVYGLRKR